MEYENLPTDSSIQNTDNPHDKLLTEFRGRKHFRMNVLHVVVTLLFSFLFFYVLFGSTDPPRLNPVIFVPGDGGSRVEAKLNKTSTVHYICDKTTSNWFTLWLNLELLVPEVIDCFIDNLRLTYDNVTRTTSNSPGVSIRIPGFGHTDAVEWLDPSVRVGSYFSPIADALSKLSYERDLSLRGAPYDFRKAPNEHTSYFVNLKALIEETYDLNGSTPVVLLAHSMGSLMCLYFLQRQSAAWKSKFIRSLVTLAAPWGGSVKAVKVFAVGDDLGVYVLSKSTLKVYQVTCPSTAWLLPSPHFWSPEEVLVETPEKNYTMANLRDYFQDLDNMQGWEMRQDVEQYALDLRPPGVEVHCLHGLHVSTPKKLVYSSAGKFPASPQYEMDDGDGTVNLRSLRGCLAWAGRQSPPLFHREFPGADHMSLLGDKALLSYLTELLRLPQPRPSLIRRVRELFHL